MSAYLLDTHVVVWLASAPERIPVGLRRRLEEAETLYVSAVSAYEIAQKVHKGHLPEARVLILRWHELIASMMAEELPVTASEMLQAGALPWVHRDPFDRMLVAQAQLNGLELVTKDAAISAYPEVSCVPWG